MHSLSRVIDGKEYTCHYNGDMSGDVVIISSNDGLRKTEAQLPYAIMEELVGQHLMDEEISRLQDMSGKDFLHATYVITHTET